MGPQNAAVRAKYLISFSFSRLPKNRAIQPDPRRINDLAHLKPAFPQSYPQKLWVTPKSL
jgi:hypothetical protein